jgi:DNA-binding GntR family transcriptional regulator
MCAVPDLSPDTSPVRLARLTPRIYRLDALVAIRRAILDGVFPPGSPLVERRVASEMGISRGPVREALHKLEEEGLVVTTPYKVTQVAEVGPQRISEITALREALEPLAVNQTLSRYRTEALRELKRRLNEMRSAGAAGERDNLIELHLAFHRTYYAMAGNSLLLQIWTLMEGQTRLYLHVHRLPNETLSDYADHHVDLYEALESGVPEHIDAAVSQHIARVRSRLLAAHPD